MSSAWPSFLLLVALGGLGACHRGEAGTSDRGESAALGGRIAARVGDEIIPLELVAKVASDQNIPSDEALHRLVDDAVVAGAARARGVDRSSAVAFRLTAARARFTADHLLAAAKAEGPPTDAEVETLSQEHWREVSRPEAVRAMHALIKVPETADAGTRQAARRLADAVQRALRGDPSTTLSPFKAAAQAALAAAGGDPALLVVESLPPFAADGTVTEGAGAMVLPFARAAHAIARTGETSPVVETTFGFHVIRLLERLPEQRMPLESRRIAFAEAVYAQRAKKASDAVIAAMRARYPSEVLPSAEQSMREVRSASGDIR